MTKDPQMTAQDVRDAQERLGLSDAQLARMLGMNDSVHVRRLKVLDTSKSSHRKVSPAMARLIRCYLDGYRPSDWPTK